MLSGTYIKKIAQIHKHTHTIHKLRSYS